MFAPLRILFAGSGAFGEPTLRGLVAAGHEVVRVYTQPDRPAGRGKRLTPTPVAGVAAAMGLDAVRTANLNAEALPPADALVVIAFGQKIGPAAVGHGRLGSVNLHASLLPRFRGAAPINWAMLAGDATTGNSVIRLADRMDAGAVLGRSAVTIGDAETAGELHDRLAADGPALVLRVLSELAAGTAVASAQDESAVTLAPKLSRATAVVDWTRPAAEVSRRINGLSPWPGCRVRVTGSGPRSVRPVASITLVRSRPGVERVDAPAGTVRGTGVVAGDGRTVDMLEVQPEGRRPMPTADYARGRPWADGMRVVPADPPTTELPAAADV